MIVVSISGQLLFMEHIDISRPFEAFNQHISSKENQRILFSAPFGSGKTYFLKEYFKSVKGETNAFWLSPVKYVVSPNEDIFEYIKYDLASQLLDYQVIQEDLPKDIGVLESSYKYIVNNPKDIFKLLFSALENAPSELAGIPDPLTKTVNKAGKFGKEVIDTLNKYQEYTKKLKSQSDSTNKVLNDYLDKSIEIKGSVFEDDLVSQMIRVGLSKVRAQHQQNVLIVDDLDRLDPEHIFRILNILSVHQDFANGQNKFGFDKIIVVCDIDNIDKIYKHKYGEYVDFDGYIEKFYSTSIFTFTNQQAVALYCQSEINVELSQDAKIILGVYLSHFVKLNELTVRSIVKHRIKPIISRSVLIRDMLINENTSQKFVKLGYTNGYGFRVFDGTDGYNVDEFYIEATDFEYLFIVKTLITIFGTFQNLKDAVDRSRKKTHESNVTDHLKQAVKVIAPMQHLMENIDQSVFLTVALNSNERFPNEGRNVIKKPSINLFGTLTNLILKWSSDKPYTGEESFYSDINVLVDEEQIRFKMSRARNEESNLPIDELLSVLEHTLVFLNNRNYLYILA